MALNPALHRDTISKVWGIINRHFEHTLVSVGRSEVASKAKNEIKAQVADLRAVVDNCAKRLASIEDYIRELQAQGAKESTVTTSGESTVEALAGDWHFLHLSTGQVFGYLKTIPETVTVIETPDPDTGSRKYAEFTIPAEVLIETEAGHLDDHYADNIGDRSVLCPCCQVHFGVAEFWKHAVWEIASKGNNVKAWQIDRENRTRWVVDISSGWRNPIYRPRDIRGMCEIGQSFASLNLTHFLSDQEFSAELDSTFQYLVRTLTS